MLVVKAGEVFQLISMVKQQWVAGQIMKQQKSSTFRELRAIRLVLESYGKDLQGKEVCHRTDNKNAEIIISVGSRVPELQLEAVAVYKLCRELNIRLSVEWLSRDDNVEADELSRIEDTND